MSVCLVLRFFFSWGALWWRSAEDTAPLGRRSSLSVVGSGSLERGWTLSSRLLSPSRRASVSFSVSFIPQAARVGNSQKIRDWIWGSLLVLDLLQGQGGRRGGARVEAPMGTLIGM